MNKLLKSYLTKRIDADPSVATDKQQVRQMIDRIHAEYMIRWRRAMLIGLIVFVAILITLVII